MNFKNFYKEDYEAVCDFLIELNLENKDHINWNWARFEWMMKHPEFDESLIKSIGLWMDGEKVVGAAIYDMYFGEAFCGVLPEYEALYPEILAYAYRELRDDNGLGIAICDESEKEIEAAKHAGFSLAEQTETVMSIGLNNVFPVKLPKHFCITELDPVQEPYAFQWLLWQGFDHGTDRAEFERDVSPKFPCSASISIQRSVSRRRTMTENMFPIAVCGAPTKPITLMWSLSAQCRHIEVWG